MKIFFTLFALVYYVSSSFSIVRTVSNDVNIPAQFTTFDAAYGPSAPGDTIYLHGSSTAYIAVGGAINKAITIIGPGFNPDKQYRLPATFSSTLFINANNINLFGIYDQFGISFGPPITNCRISRCFITSLTMSPTNVNLFIDGCCFSRTAIINFRGNTNTLLNCVFSFLSIGAGTTNCTLDHNTFMQFQDVANLSNSWISNNLFFGGITNTATNNAYNNNQVAGPLAIPGAGNTGAGNFSAPISFVDYNAGRPFYFYNNMDLAVGNAGNNAATDGTDIGAYGGGNPYAQEGEVKTLPIIREMDIMSPVVPSPGNVNVHIRATQPK